MQASILNSLFRVSLTKAAGSPRKYAAKLLKLENHFHFQNRFSRCVFIFLLLAMAAVHAEQPTVDVAKFLKTNCIKCHGPDKSKAKITVNTLDVGPQKGGHDLKTWEKILEALKSGEMPPEEEPQPSKQDRMAVVHRIESELRQIVETSGQSEQIATARRLTNFEYQNTMRDLMGFELLLSKDLPIDPAPHYKFNNTPEYMLNGPEQMERYKECATRVMASAIVDPGKPKIHKTEWKPKGKMEIGVYGTHRLLNLNSWPATGEYRIRVKASAILPPDIQEMPLRLMMGADLRFVGVPLRAEPVGTIRFRKGDSSQSAEFRGRIEDIPIAIWHAKNVIKAGVPNISVVPQNIYDNGRIGDNWDPLALPKAVIEYFEFEAPVTDVWPPEHHSRILFESPLRSSDPKAYVTEVLKRFVLRAYRRPPTEHEIGSYLKLYEMVSAKTSTLEEAMRKVLTMVLVSPQFLYHTISANGGEQQYELASKLSYFLWGSMPDDTLLDLAAKGRLSEPAVIEAQVRRMLADRRFHDFANNFVTQWLSLSKFKLVSFNSKRFPRFQDSASTGPYVSSKPTILDHMHKETVCFVMELIRRNTSVLNIVDSDFACLNEPLAFHYGVKGVFGDEIRPVAIKPEHNLGGLLTQGSVLIGNSTGSTPHPIYRAVWLREAILGDEVAPPPADVPALSETAGPAVDKAMTIKDLLQQHRQKESCNDCHSRLDPWGIPFEHYNAIGQFQPLVPKDGVVIKPFRQTRGDKPKTDKDLETYMAYLKSLDTVKVDAAARLPNGPQVNGMRELKEYLLKERKDDIAKNVLSRLLTYAIGRELTVRDRFEVERMLKQSKSNEYKLQDMLVAICQSPAFTGIQPKEK